MLYNRLARDMLLLLLESDGLAYASDSFNRANGALGGSATDGVSFGGAGLVWAADSGNFNISTNHVTPTAVVSNMAVATVDVHHTNYVVSADISTVATSVGVIIRYIDTDNYITACHNGTNVFLYKKVGGVGTYLVNQAQPYVAGENIAVIANGTTFTLLYGGTVIGSQNTISDAVLQTSTKVGVVGFGAGSVIQADNFVAWTPNAFPYQLTAPAVAVYREDASNWLIRMPIPGQPNHLIVAEWRLTIINTGLFMKALVINDLSGTTSDITILDQGSAYEYALKLGAGADVQGDYGFVGSVHGNVDQQTLTVALDTVDISAIAAGAYRYGDELIFTQTLNLIYPKDGLTVAGVSTLVHTFNSTGLTVDEEEAWNSAQSWKVYNHYSAMLPALDTAMDTYQNEGYAPATVILDGNAKQYGTQATYGIRSDSGHIYKVTMSLPTGDPGSPDGWTNGGLLMAWFQDRVDGIGKFYTDYVGTSFADDTQAVDGTTHTHQTLYVVST